MMDIDDITYSLISAVEEARQQYEQLQSELEDLESLISRLEGEL